jgi:virulence-associated protein VapD
MKSNIENMFSDVKKVFEVEYLFPDIQFSIYIKSTDELEYRIKSSSVMLSVVKGSGEI